MGDTKTRRKVVSDERRLLTVDQVADLFGIGRRTVQRWEAEGKLRAVRLGRSVRFRPEEVARLAERGFRR